MTLMCDFCHCRRFHNFKGARNVLHAKSGGTGTLYPLHSLQTVSDKLFFDAPDFLLIFFSLVRFLSFSFHRFISLGAWSLGITLLLYATEALYFRSTTLNFYVIFPCVLNSKYALNTRRGGVSRAETS